MILFVKKSPLLACCYCFLGGCGMVQKLAISTTVGPTMERAAKEIERESNWQTFRGSIPGQPQIGGGDALPRPTQSGASGTGPQGP